MGKILKIKPSEEFVLGVSDYLFMSNSKKDTRVSVPKWMKFKVHKNDWLKGFNHAKELDISR